MKNIFKSTVLNEGWHKLSNDNGVRVATAKIPDCQKYKVPTP
jgi:hypothetical protein